MRINFRSFAERFGNHIDGQITSAEVSFRSGGQVTKACVVVRFYPWWEHPQYIAAREAGKPWAFDSGPDAERDVVIEAVSPWRCDLRPGRSAIDIGFHTEVPDLWEFEDAAEIVCNSDFDRRALVDGLVDRGIPNVSREMVLQHISPYTSYRPPYSLGFFPYSLFPHVRDELRRLGVDLFIAREPVVRQSLIAMFIDDNVTIVAEDFEVDVPEFAHRPEWFRPRR